MSHSTDQQLLRDYAEYRSETAFTELVRRHVDFIYSAALRMVRDGHLAGDVTQGVFLALAKNARQVADYPALESWLHGTTRNQAANAVRAEVRRRNREQEAAIMNEILSSGDDVNWEQVAPHLDEALGELSEPERDALLLRYFKKHDFRAVGLALGVSDDTAQKRVTRAVEKLREFFSKRKIRMGAGSLGVLISANAVQSAPVGLATTISTAVFAGTAVTTSTIIAATVKTIAMTTLQKTFITATLAVVAGAGIYEAKQAHDARAEVQTLQQEQKPLADQARQLQNKFADATNRLAGLLAENKRLQSSSNQNELLKLRGEVSQLQQTDDDPAAKSEKDWLAKVNKLKQKLEETPEAKIPEFQFLTEQDWLNAASGKLDSEIDYRRAFASLRNAAENKFASMTESALQKFYRSNDSKFPSDLSELAASFESPIDDAIWQRWQITSSASAPNMQVGDPIITQKAAVDDLFDQRIVIGPRGFGSGDFLSSEIMTTLKPVYKAYQNATGGEATSPSDLLPYATTPEQSALVQKMIQRASFSQ